MTERRGLLDSITDRTKVIALIILTAEAILAGTIFALDPKDRLTAYTLATALLIIGLIGCFWLEHQNGSLRAADSGLTRYRPLGDRREKLIGRWKGTVVQNISDGENPFVAKADFYFHIPVDDDVIFGEGTVSGTLGEKKVELLFRARGGFLHNEFLRLEYDPADTGTKQFGSLLLRLNDLSQSLNGRYQGYGAFNQRIVSGTFDLEKLPS